MPRSSLPLYIAHPIHYTPRTTLCGFLWGSRCPSVLSVTEDVLLKNNSQNRYYSINIFKVTQHSRLIMIKALLAFDPWVVNGQTRSRILNIKKIYSAVLRSITIISLKSVHSLSSFFANNQTRL